MTNFKIIFSDESSFEIDYKIAQRSQVIRDLVTDTSAEQIILPNTTRISKSDILEFYQKYDELIEFDSCQKFTICQLLAFLEVANYFDDLKQDFLIESLAKELLRRQNSLQESIDDIRERFSKLGHNLQIMIKEMIRSPKIVIPYVESREINRDSKSISILTNDGQVYDEDYETPIRNNFIGDLYSMNPIHIENEYIRPSGCICGIGPTINKCHGIPNCIMKMGEMMPIGGLLNRVIYGPVSLGYATNPINAPPPGNFNVPAPAGHGVWGTGPNPDQINIVEDLVQPPPANFNVPVPIGPGPQGVTGPYGPLVINYKWLSYHNKRLYHNHLFSNHTSKLHISIGEENDKKEIVLNYYFGKISVTRYNTYIFGPVATLVGTLSQGYKSFIKWQLEDQEDNEFYNGDRLHDVIVILDITSNSEVFRLILPRNQTYFVDDTGRYIVTLSQSRKNVELYDITQKKRVLKKSLKGISLNNLENLTCIVDHHNNHIIINDLNQNYLILDFKGRIINDNIILKIDSPHIHIPMRGGILRLIYENQRKYHLYLVEPCTFQTRRLLLTYHVEGNLPTSVLNLVPRDVILKYLHRKIVVSPDGEKFVLYGDKAYHGKLFPNNEKEYQSLEFILEAPEQK